MRLTNSPSSGVCFYIQAIAQILTFPHCLGPSDPPRTPLSLARLSAPRTPLLAPPAVPPPPAPSRPASPPPSPLPTPSGPFGHLLCPARHPTVTCAILAPLPPLLPSLTISPPRTRLLRLSLFRVVWASRTPLGLPSPLRACSHPLRPRLSTTRHPYRHLRSLRPQHPVPCRSASSDPPPPTSGCRTLHERRTTFGLVSPSKAVLTHLDLTRSCFLFCCFSL